MLGPQRLLAIVGNGRDDEPHVLGQLGRQPGEAARRVGRAELVEGVEKDEQRPGFRCLLELLAELHGQVVVLGRDRRLVVAVLMGDLMAERIEQRASFRRRRGRADEAHDSDAVREHALGLFQRLGHQRRLT